MFSRLIHVVVCIMNFILGCFLFEKQFSPHLVVLSLPLKMLFWNMVSSGKSVSLFLNISQSSHVVLVGLGCAYSDLPLSSDEEVKFMVCSFSR